VFHVSLHAKDDDGDTASVYTMEALQKTKGVNLTHGGVLLIALMSGGDYAKVSSP
jgi:hypothetical protein